MVCPIDKNGYCKHHDMFHLGPARELALDPGPTGRQQRAVWDEIHKLRDGGKPSPKPKIDRANLPVPQKLPAPPAKATITPPTKGRLPTELPAHIVEMIRNKPSIAARLQKCPHLGEPTGESKPCEVCGKKEPVMTPLHTCKLHGTVSVDKLVKGEDGKLLPACATCKDHPRFQTSPIAAGLSLPPAPPPAAMKAAVPVPTVNRIPSAAPPTKPTTWPLPQRHVVISLERRQDRRRLALEQFAAAGIEPTVFDAIDASKLPLPAGWKDGRGAWGCIQSHVRVLEMAIADGTQVLAVYEDDAVLCQDFKAKMEELVQGLPPDWDAFFLGGQFCKKPRPAIDRRYVLTTCTWRTHAYIVRDRYIRQLYALWSGNQGHCDKIWARNQGKARVYAPAQWLVGQGAFKSDISGRNDKERWWIR